MVWIQIECRQRRRNGEIVMKRIALCTILLLLFLGVAGCTKEDLTITAEEVTADTLIARKNGELQVATVEDFNKSYYNLEELKDFVKKQVDAFQSGTGEDEISIDEVEERENKAIMILTYSGMNQYAAFNKVTAAYFTGGVQNISMKLPETLVSVKDNSLASTKEIMDNEKNLILILKEPYQIVVEGKIKYYSENSKLLDENTLQGAEDGTTIVVFR